MGDLLSKKLWNRLLLLVAFGLGTMAFVSAPALRTEEIAYQEKIGGVNFVSPAKKVGADCFNSLNRISSQWVALNPFAFGRPKEPKLSWDLDWQWWGERSEGIKTMIKYAKAQNLKVMIKPHIWVRGEGWAGDFVCDTEEDWATWETYYERYVMMYAQIAADYKIEAFCLGTEVRKSVKDRPHFWEQLIDKIRAVYGGKLTYAANWDNYMNVRFWNKLDYIGVDNYYPVSDQILPEVDDMIAAWEPFFEEMKGFSKKVDRPVLFTEYGYRSIDQTAWKQWLLPEHWENAEGEVNLTAQVNAYSALYKTFWQEDWVAGGFLWKWYARDNESGGKKDRDFTPQHKPVEALIKAWYQGSKS